MALPALPYCSAPRPECDSLAEALGQCEYLASEGALTTAKVAFQALVVSSALLLCAFYCCKHYVRGFKLWLVTYYTLVVAGAIPMLQGCLTYCCLLCPAPIAPVP